MSRPRLIVVIGANGAGKTTWSNEHRHRLPLHFYNADSIAEGLGDANDPQQQAEARAIVDAAIETRLRSHDPFTSMAKYFGHYPTPKATAEQLLRWSDVYGRDDEKALRILEPSAGEGNLATRMAAMGHQVDCIEIQPGLASVLETSGTYRSVRCGTSSSSPRTRSTTAWS